MSSMTHLISALPLVADALGRKYGVKVLIGGSRAYTDGRNIHIPALPLDTDETAINLARGFLDHEAAHLRHTDFAVLTEASLSGIEKHVWNILEDFMVERKLAAIYPGCAQNFSWLAKHIFLRSDNAPAVLPAEMVFDWLLLHLRSLAVPELVAAKMELETALQQAYPTLLHTLEPLVNTIPQQCHDTVSCLRMAREIVQVLQTYVANRPEAAGPQEESEPSAKGGESGDNPLQKAGKCEKTANEKCGSSANTTQTTCKDKGNKSEGAAQQAGPAEVSQQDDGDSATDTSHEAASGQPTLADILQDGSTLQNNDLGAVVGKLLEALGQNCRGKCLEVAIARPAHISPLPMAEIAEIRRDTSALRTRLTGLLQAKVHCQNNIGRKGKVDTRRIGRIAVGDPRVFARRNEKQGINTTVHILLDASGSMKNDGKITLACHACYAVAEALSKISGISVAVTSFPNGMEYDAEAATPYWVTVCPILRCKDKFHSKFGVDANGGTPMAQALWWVLQQMSPLIETRKILLILSDGEPDDLQDALKAIEAHHAYGHEVYGIGIISTAISQLVPGRNSKTISDLCELAPAMFGLLQTALVKNIGDIHENAY